MASVTFDQAECWYPGADAPSVKGIDLDIEDGEFMVLVGPSGCGKSTTLRMLAGLETVTSGRVLIGGNDVTSVPPKDRDIAMVFQNYALYPHMTVAQNMGFALEMAKVAKAEREKRVNEAAEMLGLTPYLGRKPKALSGGQRQRVAMGRAIVRQPQVFCMDEPLSNLDAKMRIQTRTDIASLQAELGTTTVYVTHDQVEAMTLGDRVAVMNGGELQQVAAPMELYARPANVFVAGFIGSPPMNLFPSEEPSAAVVGGYAVPAGRAGALPESVVVGVRAEDWRTVPSAEPGLDVLIEVVEHLGSDSFLHGTIGDDGSRIVMRAEPTTALTRGDKVRVAVDGTAVHLFDGETGDRIE